MELLYKPEADQALRRWDAFWQGEMLDRPPVVMYLHRPGTEEVPGASQILGFEGDFEQAGGIIDAALASTLFLGEAFPSYAPSYGPSQVAGFLGCQIVLNEDSGDTSWVEPCVKDWESTIPIRLDPQNLYWQRMLAFHEYLRPRARGRFLIGHLDLQGHVAALAAMRGYERMCLDLVDTPELVDRALEQVCPLFEEIYDGVYEAAGMAEVGYTTGWWQLIGPGKTSILSCDFSALMSPSMFNRWVMPCLEAESEFLDHSTYHLDGPDALCHVPSLLSLSRVHCLQWVIGAGLTDSRPPTTWVELYQQFQAAGKACQIYATIEEIKVLHPQLKPNLVTYVTWPETEGQTETEGEEFLQWLVENS